jgi:threonine 3-dehydrogenase
VTHTFPVSEYREAFATMLSSNSGKVILDWAA